MRQMSNILNRSPWQVTVRGEPGRNAQFSFPERKAAEAYCEELKALGLKPKLVQLKTSFQLRLRRKGVKQQFITFDSYEAAEKAQLKIESDLAVSILRDYAAATQFTPRDLMERYIVEVAPGHKGGDVEVSRMRRLMRTEAFVDKKLAALATEDLQDFINDRLTEVAPATVDRDIDIISQVLNYAHDVWKIAPAESPMDGLRRPKYFNERDRRLKGDEEARLLAAAHADENEFIEPAIILAIETAMRRGELLSLTIENIFFEERYAYLPDTKNGRSRKVPLSSRAIGVLKALPAKPSVPLLNLSENALKIAFFRRVLPRAKIKDLHFHDLRHEAISRLAESGQFQLIELQAISGHRDTRMLTRYAHLCSGKLSEKMDRLQVGTITQYLHRGRLRKVVKEDKEVLTKPATVADQASAPIQGAKVITFSSFRAQRSA